MPVESCKAEETTVDICLCTFRRASVVETLRSLAVQSGDHRFRVIVSDNDDGPSAQRLVERAALDLRLRVAYVHAPARNISIARNAALELARSPFIAFIDDDELASVDWLDTLLRVQRETGADAVVGPVSAQYDSGHARWVREADLHSTRLKLRSDGEPVAGYTSNALVRSASIGEFRFDLALGRSGGEDTLFFRQLRSAGARLAYAPLAVVVERVGDERATLQWLLRRSFRSGQSHGRAEISVGGRRALAIAASSAGKLVFVLGGSLRHVGNQGRFYAALYRGALHLGVIAYALGVPDEQIYGSAEGVPVSLPPG